MSDIFGRSTIAPTNVITKKQISSMIRKYVTSGLNLVNVDPGEIVVFGDKQGKLKTSDISLDSLLTIPKDAADDSIAVFKQNKITAGSKLSSIINSIIELRNDFFAHVANYATLRRNLNTADNTIEKFFGKKNIKPDEVTTTLPDLKKSIEDIKTITNTIKTDSSKLDKIKIPHSASIIKGLSYVVHQESDMEYISTDKGYLKEIKLSSWYETITGIYRFTILSKHQFNILIFVRDDEAGLTEITHMGVNTVLLYINDVKKNYTANIKSIDEKVIRTKFGFIVEYVSAI